MEVREMPEQQTLAIRVTVAAEQLPQTMGQCYAELAQYMQEEGIAFAGAPYARYYNMDMSALNVEMGFPVEKEFPDKGSIVAEKLPACRVVWGLHRGPYQNLEKTYEKLAAFADAKGLKLAEWMYEQYLNSPEEVIEDDLKTEIFLPIVD